MKTSVYAPVNYSIAENEETGAVMLIFQDSRQLMPGTAPVPIEIIQIPFDAEAWESFQRAIAETKVSPIVRAMAVPSG